MTPAEAIATLAVDLDTGEGLPLAAAVVLDGHRQYAAIIVSEVHRRRRSGHSVRGLVGLVEAWGRGDDAAVARAQTAWLRNGCEDCALSVLAGTGDWCAHCGLDVSP